MALARKLTAKIHEIKAHTEKVTCLDLGETGRVLVTGGRDRNVNLWAIGEEKCFMSLTGHNGSIECVKFAYNDDYVYSADDIGIIRRWDLNAQTTCSTLNGHMKSVRTLDFNPSGEYVVSGSNDTTVRLWDVRNQNKCIKTYRGHIANVNSVKFSPDGLWIASAGTEGSVIIWDIRKSKQIIQFTERASPVTCIQFHPYEFLLAAGRNDGSIYIYDLESQQLISKTDHTSFFSGHTVKCTTFSENGECLFVGTAEGVSVIGWEPDREFDHIESTWGLLGDMKIVNRKLICGSYEQEYVAIHALSIDRVIPFYNPSNVTPPAFNHNHTTRKSFSRGNQKLRLSIGATNTQEKLPEENEESNVNMDGQISPNLSIELIDDGEEQPATSNGSVFNGYISGKKLNHYNFSSLSTQQHATYTRDFDGPSSLKMPGEPDIYRYNQLVDNYADDLGYNPNDSNPPIISNYEEAELEDFPVNNAQQPDYAPKMDLQPPPTKSHTAVAKHKISTQVQRKTNPIGIPVKAGTQRKLSNVTSYSTMDLHKMEENVLVRKQSGSSIVAPRLRRQDSTGLPSQHHQSQQQQQQQQQNNKSRNITVQIVTKPPPRSKTSFDLRANSNPVSTPIQRTPSHSLDDNSEIQLLSSYHEQVYQELSNRHATLQLIRNSTRSHDIVGALKQAIKMSGRTVFVDLLGAILEKTSTWNLDMCLLLLPEIYELLQSQHKFHYTRACDTLRVILSNFLPIIQENVDPWSPAKCLGVDITREERQRKCLECQHWLLRIRNLSDDRHVGSTLTQLQNMIVNI